MTSPCTDLGMTKRRLTKRVLKGLRIALSLAQADLEAQAYHEADFRKENQTAIHDLRDVEAAQRWLDGVEEIHDG